MKRKQMKAKEVNKLIAHFGLSLSKKDSVELLDEKIIIVNKEPQLFYYEKRLIPTLKFLVQSENKNVLKKITIDMGAIKFVTSGADVMRPGIVAIEPGIAIDEAVVIVDEKHRKPLAVGIALVDAVEMEQVQKGKVVKIIHYVGDELWCC